MQVTTQQQNSKKEKEPTDYSFLPNEGYYTQKIWTMDDIHVGVSIHGRLVPSLTKPSPYGWKVNLKQKWD